MTFVAGTILFLLGVLRYLLAPAYWSINLRTQLPTIVSGAALMVLGALLLLAGFWTIRNKNKVIQIELDEIDERKRKQKPRTNGDLGRNSVVGGSYGRISENHLAIFVPLTVAFNACDNLLTLILP